MSQETRKASDVLLQIESRISNLEKMVSSQDVLFKVIANKLSDILKLLSKESYIAPNISVEAVDTSFVPNSQFVSNVDPERNILISAENSLKMEIAPQGFRRNSRPETFSGDGAYLTKPPPVKEQEIKFPTQVPRRNGGSEVVLLPDNNGEKNDSQLSEMSPRKSVNNLISIPVKQRVVDNTGKSVFLADVEIFDENNESKIKTRTNGTGKWMASLPIGYFKIIIKKRDSVSKEIKETLQNIQIDGSSSPIELRTLIIS